MAVLDDLIQLGFEPITEWVIKGTRIGPASFSWQDHGGWLYAFVVDSEVKYIGLTDRILRSRLSDYSHIKNTQTDRLRELIFGELKAGRAVQIYGRKEANKNHLVAEEFRFRVAYRPFWNRI